jgi:hypothetical protein
MSNKLEPLYQAGLLCHPVGRRLAPDNTESSLEVDQERYGCPISL